MAGRLEGLIMRGARAERVSNDGPCVAAASRFETHRAASRRDAPQHEAQAAAETKPWLGELFHIRRTACAANWAPSLVAPKELGRMCREAGLHDLAYLLEVAAAEAGKVRQANGAEAGHPLAPTG
jgi:hypothetical protein